MAERRVLVDTGPLVAFVSEDDEHHEICVDAFAALPAPVFTCWPVLTEAAWLLRRRPLGTAKLFDAFSAGMVASLSLGDDAITPIAALMRRYEEISLELADAALVYLAERENIRTVFTLDRRDFSIIRLKRNRTLKLLPDPP